MPTRIPASLAASCAPDSWLSAIHCSHTKNSTSALWAAANSATAGDDGRRYSAGHSRQFIPSSPTSAHHVANRVSPRPSRRTKSSRLISRAGVRPKSKMIRRAASFASQIGLRSIRSTLATRASNLDLSDWICRRARSSR